MESGDMSPILERRDDELGQLIKALNSMTKGLAEKSQIKEVLDRFVAPSITQKILSQLDDVNLEGENVNATVLFADIVGFTSMSEKLEPAKVSELLNEYFSYYSSCARLHFGTVDKFLGDCIMIVFGATKEDPHHRYHAAGCALLMQELTRSVNNLRREQGLAEIHIRIGINSGDMLAGLLGTNDRMEYTVLGDAVNLASRLCNEARANEIIIQDELHDQLASDFEVTATNNRTIKVRGKSNPVSIYNLNDITRLHSCSDRDMLKDVLDKAKNSLTNIPPEKLEYNQ
jgi:adenylate cyclase